MKIKYTLTSALLLFALIPALIVIFLSAAYFKSHVQYGFVTTLTIATDIESTNIANYFSVLANSVNPLHTIPLLENYLLENFRAPTDAKADAKNDSEADISQSLKNRTAGRDDVLSMTIVDTRGIVLASSTPDTVGTTFHALPPHALTQKTYSVVMLPDDPVSADSRFALLVPLEHEGQLLGVAYVEYNTNFFEKTLSEIAMHRSGKMFLLDTKGKIIASSTGIVGKNISKDPTLFDLSERFFGEDFRQHTSGIMRYTIADVPRIAFFKVVPETQWVLLASMNDEAFSTFLRNFEQSLSLLCGALVVLSVFGSLLVTRRIVAPVNDFIATIQRIKEGDHKARFRYTTQNELGMIAAAFNGLVHATNKRTAKLRALSAKLGKQQAQLETLTHNIPGGLFRCSYDQQGTFLFISDGYLDILSYDRESFNERCGNCFRLTIHPDSRDTVMADIAAQLQEKESCEIRYLALMAFGSTCWVQVKGELKSDGTTGKRWVDGIATDISDHVQSQEYLDQTMKNLRETLQELKVSEERLRLIIDHSSDIVFEWSAPQRYIYLSPGFKKRFGYTPLLPDGFHSLLHFKELHPEDIHPFRSWVLKLGSGRPTPPEDFRLRTADGRYLWTRHQITIIRDKNGTIVRGVGLLIDVHEAKCAELRLQDKAERDPLSGLFNRATFEEKAQIALTRAQESPVKLAFLFLDIDDFRKYNTDYGHAFGDRVITFIGETLLGLIKNVGFAGRRGGDEFVVCYETSTSARVRTLADTMQHQLNAGLTARGKIQVSVSCSIGIVLVNTPSTSFENLIHAADLAMYEVKNTGKGSYSIVQV